MFQLKRSMYTETAHLLRDHPGLCKNLHGHSYKWTVLIQAEQLFEDMIMDFTDLKKAMETVIGFYDHAIVVDETHWKFYKNFFSDSQRIIVFKNRPTAEIMAKDVYCSISPLLPSDIELVSITCRETRNNEAIYYEK